MGRGRPKGITKAAAEDRYQEILRIATEHTFDEDQPQTVRHIYYLCSGLAGCGKILLIHRGP